MNGEDKTYSDYLSRRAHRVHFKLKTNFGRIIRNYKTKLSRTQSAAAQGDKKPSSFRPLTILFSDLNEKYLSCIVRSIHLPFNISSKAALLRNGWCRLHVEYHFRFYFVANSFIDFCQATLLKYMKLTNVIQVFTYFVYFGQKSKML